MAYLDVSRIASWHAHIYFDATNRDDAAKFREVVAAQFGDRVQMGRFHERWTHSAGCRQWFTLVRDTVTHEIEPSETQAPGAPA